MALKLKSEMDLLNIDVRKEIIEALESEENLNRKKEAKRRFDVYKDYASKYVMEIIEKEMGRDTVSQVKYRCSNVSLAKVIINKKAMIYSRGVKRIVAGDEKSQKQIDDLVRLLKLNRKMKTADQYLELFYNTVLQVYPYPDADNEKEWRIKINAMVPYRYDVLENANDPEQAIGHIFSYFTIGQLGTGQYAPQNMSSIHSQTMAVSTPNFRDGDGIDQVIADSPNDQGAGKKQYVWWTKSLHFTTDDKGGIIQDLGELSNENPFGVSTFVDLHKNQDGSYWALGGEDIIDGTVLINLFLTDLFYIAKFQSMGVFWMTGKGLPKTIKIGPAEVLTLEQKSTDEPTPQVGFATSNPQLADYMNNIKEYVTMLLKTNKLKGSSVVGVESSVTAESGIQELIDKAELAEDQEDITDVFIDGERAMFKKYARVHNYLLAKGLLAKEFADIGKIDENIDVGLKFNPPQSVQTEGEKVDIIKKRLDAGLDSHIDAIMRDNPGMTREEAEKKMIEIRKDQLLSQREQLKNQGMLPGPNDKNMMGGDNNNMDGGKGMMNNKDKGMMGGGAN